MYKNFRRYPAISLREALKEENMRDKQVTYLDE
jgi:hypothetical protein